MKITKDKYFKNMARALLKGYFAGLKECKKCQKDTSNSTKQK